MVPVQVRHLKSLSLFCSLVNSVSAAVGHFSRTATAQQLTESVAAGASAAASTASAALASAGVVAPGGPAFLQDDDEVRQFFYILSREFLSV